uniref:Uncharacterized protein n=1 Tax=Amphimedon queenslandica TaxID=400682 RepID=A0A1X7V3Z2_AMPQE
MQLTRKAFIEITEFLDSILQYTDNTWKQQLRWKFKNGRRGQGTSNKRSKKRHIDGIIEEDEYRKLIADLKREWSQKKKHHSKVKDIMSATFANRQTWIVSGEPAVLEVLDTFPCLERANYLELELKLLLGKEESSDFMVEWPLWRDKVLLYVDAEKTTMKRLNKIATQYKSEKERLKQFDDTLEDLQDFFALQYFQSILSYRAEKQIIYSFSDDVNVDDVIRDIAISQPCLVRFLSDVGCPKYHIVIEGQMLHKVTSTRKALLNLIAAYYVFNISYPPLQSATLIFIQHYIMNITFEKKLPSSVAALGSNLIRIDLQDMD